MDSVAESHKVLFHYTTANGLLGIIESQCLWATHIEYLNDHEEHRGFFKNRLEKLLEKPIDEAINEIYLNNDNEDKNLINELGGVDKVKKDMIKDLKESIQDATLRLNEPYVVAFCVPESDEDNNGLLSQWRGYGKDGGYAVVFDTEKLQQLLEEEGKNCVYIQAVWGDVHYSNETGAIKPLPEIEALENELHKTIKNFIANRNSESLEPLLPCISSLSCFYKHEGFKEEREVRVVAILSGDNDLINQVSQSDVNKQIKSKKFRNKDGLLIPYICLFDFKKDGCKVKLPITKIIIGPNENSIKRKQAVELLLSEHEIKADVVISSIPYLGG
jgi:hypothetical protein